MGRQHRVLSALLSVTLVTGFAPASAYAADDVGQPNLSSAETAVSEEGELSGQAVPEGLEKSFATQLEEASAESLESNDSTARGASPPVSCGSCFRVHYTGANGQERIVA